MKIKIMARITLLIIVALLVIMFTGCRSPKTIKETSSIYKEFYRDSLVLSKGETVSSQLDSATLGLIMSSLKSGKKQYIVPSRTGDLQLKFYLDELGRLRADCEQKDKFYNALIKEIQKTENSSEQKTIPASKMPWWGWVLIAVVGVISFIVKPLIK